MLKKYCIGIFRKNKDPKNNPVNSLVDLYEKIDIVEKEINDFNKLEKFAANFDYAQLDNLLVDGNSADSLSLHLGQYKTIYAEEKILKGLMCPQSFLQRFLYQFNQLSSGDKNIIYVEAILVFWNVVYLFINIFNTDKSPKVLLSILFLLIFSFFVFENVKQGNYSSKKDDIQVINITKHKQIKLYELRTLFMQLKRLGLQPKIKILLERKKSVEMFLHIM